MPPTSKYGSLTSETYNSSHDEEENAEPYELENTRYIVSTAEERRKQCLTALFPVILCVLLMGGIAFSLSQSFSHFYPSHARPTNGRESQTTIEVDNNVHIQDNSHAECGIHNKCQEKGLIGLCCPTDQGVFLDCC